MAKIRQQDGFIAIIALGIFALLSLFGIIVQLTVVHTFNSVKDTSNYYAAKDTTDSMIEYLQNQLKTHEAGYNEGPFTCVYQNGQPVVGSAAVCNGFVGLVGTKKTTITYEIKGRPTDVQRIKTAKCGPAASNFNASCYVTPLVDGDAGSRCQMYKPAYSVNAGSSTIVDQAISGVANLDQLDFSCNWNKLTFGSSLTDRVAIPLYYDSSAPGAGLITTTDPFWDPPGVQPPLANRLMLRLRTPCKPFGDAVNGVLPAGTRARLPGGDETSCSVDPQTNERYRLNLDADEIVVQWQLTGMCGDEECGVVGFPDAEQNSGLYESKIQIALDDPARLLMDINKLGQPTHLNDKERLLSILTIIRAMQKPVLTLFLNNSLISDENLNIPYLEYQLLSNKPVGSSKIKLEVTVNVDGSSFKKTLYKEETKQLIDFAIQN